jgi:hypothetical protein
MAMILQVKPASVSCVLEVGDARGMVRYLDSWCMRVHV